METEEIKRPPLALTYLKLVGAAILWGGTFIAGRVVSQGIDPYSAAFWRFAIASICLLVLTRNVEERLPTPRKHQYIPLILLGLSGIACYNIFFFKGLELIEAGRASVIVAQNPIFIALLSAYFFKERLTFTKTFAVCLSVCGACIVITQGHLNEVFHGQVGAGELYILGCVASWVTYSLLGKAVMTALSPLASVTYSVLIGTFILFFPALSHGAFRKCLSYSFVQWIALMYLGLFGTVLGFLWFYQGIQHIGPMKSGMFINIVPVSGIVLGILLLGEQLTVSLLIGGACACAGIYLMNKSPHP
jgi:drug/metabolite transporter (DMT)-like permease